MATQSAARTAPKTDLAPVFARLKQILKPFEDRLAVKEDSAKCYYLETRQPAYRGKPLCFGAVRLGKAYVGFYLMSVYAFPDLARAIPAGLQKRHHGKSCFNFSKVEEDLMEDLARITQDGFARFARAGWQLNVTKGAC
jgi:hypothetical protein